MVFPLSLSLSLSLEGWKGDENALSLSRNFRYQEAIKDRFNGVLRSCGKMAGKVPLNFHFGAPFEFPSFPEIFFGTFSDRKRERKREGRRNLSDRFARSLFLPLIG